MKLYEVIGALVIGLLAINTARAQHDHKHHYHKPAIAPLAEASVEAPPLKILMPENRDNVGSTLGVVFETPADLAAMTMGAAKVGVHLTVDLEGTTLMPTRQQLITLGKNRYLFLFDLPAKPGPNTIKLYWSDAQHRTMTETVQMVTVTVAPR